MLESSSIMSILFLKQLKSHSLDKKHLLIAYPPLKIQQFTSVSEAGITIYQPQHIMLLNIFIDQNFIADRAPISYVTQIVKCKHN